MKKIILFISALFISSMAYASANSDLIVSDVKYDKTDERFSIKISNIGTSSSSSSFRTKVSIGDKDYFVTSNEALDRNQSIWVYLDSSRIAPCEDKTYVKVFVDADNNVSEDNENNNSYIGLFYIQSHGASKKNYYTADDWRYNSRNDTYDKYDQEDDYYKNDKYYDKRYDRDDLDDLQVSDLQYNKGDNRLAVKIYNNSSYDFTKDFRIKVRISGNDYYYTVDKDIPDHDHTYRYIDIRDFSIPRDDNYTVSASVDNSDSSVYSETFYIYQRDSSGYGSDLRVTDLIYDRNTDKISVKIYNRGSYSYTKDFSVKVSINGQSRYYDVSKDVSAGASEWTSLSIANFDISNGNYIVTASIDGYDYTENIYLYDPNYRYNDYRDPYSGERLPDLRVDDVKYNRARGDLDIKISNRGTVDLTRSFRVRISINGKFYYYRVDNDIDRNEAITISVPTSDFDMDDGRSYVVRVVADVDEDIRETDESNNSYFGRINYYDRFDDNDYYSGGYNSSRGKIYY